MHVSTFFKINVVGKPQKFSSEVELACPSTKLFRLEQFPIYGILYNGKHWCETSNLDYSKEKRFGEWPINGY